MIRNWGWALEVKQGSGAKGEFEQKLQCQSGADPEGTLKTIRFTEFIKLLEANRDANAGE